MLNDLTENQDRTWFWPATRFVCWLCVEALGACRLVLLNSLHFLTTQSPKSIVIYTFNGFALFFAWLTFRKLQQMIFFKVCLISEHSVWSFFYDIRVVNANFSRRIHRRMFYNHYQNKIIAKVFSNLLLNIRFPRRAGVGWGVVGGGDLWSNYLQRCVRSNNVNLRISSGSA